MRNSKASQVNRSTLSLRRQLRRLPSRVAAFLLRCWFWANRSARVGRAGFVLPTTVLLLLMVSLTVGALSYRSFTRASQTIAYRDQQIVDEIAAPAVDRAKAKLEYLFTQDARVAEKRPPSSSDLQGALLHLDGLGVPITDPNIPDPYTLPDETKLRYPADNTRPAPIWSFPYQGSTVVYSIAVADRVINDTNSPINRVVDPTTGTLPLTIDSNDVPAKAANLITRNGPLNSKEVSDACPVGALSGNGWYEVSSARLEKNVQVNVVTFKGDSGSPGRTASAAEYQQVRSAARGNRWGAWFRYDLEIFPGPTFRWNGAMHTDGNLMTEQSLRAYLVSSPSSCISDPLSSEITMRQDTETDVNGNETVTFQGQLVGGGMTQDNFGLAWSQNAQAPDFHTIRFNNATPPVPDRVQFEGNSAATTTGDSITDPVINAKPSSIALDPIALFTRGESRNRGTGWTRLASWSTDALSLNKTAVKGRVALDQENPTRPFVDDGYRADNRYGPKPEYNSQTPLPTGTLVGTNIASTDPLVADQPDFDVYGLDGYWERRARRKGLRIVVGQRLELGNRYGWQANDPLYPPLAATSLSRGTRKPKDAYEVRQQRSLRDNLAAVQGMVVYHYTQGTNGESPYICAAATAHPGTIQTAVNSRTFDSWTARAGSPLEVNFLQGKGTNGWEFNAAPLASSDYFDDTNDTIGAALHNLAYFAGDPKGGAPSFPAEQTDGFVHPYPYLSMWGDYSILRRVLVELGSANNNPADQATLDSAACTLGMLAYNLKSLKEEYDAIANNLSDATAVDDIAAKLAALTPQPPSTAQASDWLTALKAANPSYTYAKEAEVIALYRQVARDRRLGFKTGNTDNAGTQICTTADFSGATAANQTILLDAFCSASSPQRPAYPSLFYIFPTAEHDHVGNGAEPQPTNEEYLAEGGTPSKYVADITPGSPPSITGGINGGSVRYKQVDPATIALDPLPIGSFNQPTTAALPTDTFADANPTGQRATLSENVVSNGGTLLRLAFLDKAMMDGRELLSARVMDLNVNQLTTADVGSTSIKWIPEKDGIVYAFREDAVREDSIVRPHRSTVQWGGGGANDCSIFDNLIGPNTPNVQSDCEMRITPTDGSQLGTFDPPLNTDTGISPKPVDMTPDPDRRPHGFRLFNGENLGRSNSADAAGITFVTDNVVYIKGNFNLHEDKTTAGSTDFLEEFDTKLGENFASFANTQETAAMNLFYGRERDDLSQKFARPDGDTWRPAEIFADAITILSDTFLDGVVEDAYLMPWGGAGNEGQPFINSSYLNFNRPVIDRSTPLDPRDWVRENWKLVTSSTVEPDPASPIRVNRDGNIFLTRGAAGNIPAASPPFSYGLPDTVNATDRRVLGTTKYSSFDIRRYISFYDGETAGANQISGGAGNITDARRRETITADRDGSPTRVNALLITGIIPSRAGQSYGGLHNAPRLLEYWKVGTNNLPLFMSGGFFQLNFSTQATAPFDQDAWTPTEWPQLGGSPTQQSIPFYEAPKRVWGYDVALQYTAAAPISQRFVTLGRPRSEFYRELPLDDPYIQVLCNAPDENGDNPISCN